MRKRTLTLVAAATLVSSAAVAADLPRRAPPPVVFVPPPVFTWTGLYIGANAGYAFSDKQDIETIGNSTLTRTNVALNRRPRSLGNEQDGFTGGGQIGYNLQVWNGVVLGAEADIMYVDHDTTRRFTSTLGDPATFNQRLNFLGTVRARVGYAFDNVLLFGTGGFAYGDVDYSAQFNSNGAGNPLAYTGRFNDIETGYAYGGGIEYALPTDSFLNFFRASAVTMKVEYLRYQLNNRQVLVNSINPATGLPFVPAATGSYTTDFRNEGNIVRAGLNYKFGGY